ncbi:LapA family protein [Thermosulfurimonas sp.]|uniref:LapA family protein n=1 Tax=Thermosulfurimonas sp. TaxID=2080236 RepID=UPI0025EA8ECF|nr:LapA family protein [Thermosulfurimonas sp.]
MEFYLILAALLGVLIAAFAIQNATPVAVKFLVWEFQSSLAVIVILSLLAGMILIFLISLPGRLKRRKELYDKNKRIAELEKRLTELEKTASSAQTTA